MDAKEKAQIEFDALLERLAKPSTLRLHLGEMTAQELRTSQATVRFVLSQMDRATPFLTSILAQSAQSDADDSTALLQQAYELTRYAAAPFYSSPEKRETHGDVDRIQPTTEEWWKGLREQIEALQPALKKKLEGG